MKVLVTNVDTNDTQYLDLMNEPEGTMIFYGEINKCIDRCQETRERNISQLHYHPDTQKVQSITFLDGNKAILGFGTI